jgi:hypothetical protein
MLLEPDTTTCKYLYRKDLPWFVVDEGVAEHAAEFASYSGIAHLYAHTPIPQIRYNEKLVWEHHVFDPLTHALAQYSQSTPVWVFIQALSGGVDGRRTLSHASLVRRFMHRCDTWKSSYRLVLAVLQEIDQAPCFSQRDIYMHHNEDEHDMMTEALWDVFFCRIGSVQEYGFHAGIEELMWATDSLGDAVVDLNWALLKPVLEEKGPYWTQLIITHAEHEHVFFSDTTELHSEVYVSSVFDKRA